MYFAFTASLVCVDCSSARQNYKELVVSSDTFLSNFFSCLLLLDMLGSSGWRHSFAPISTKWVQGSGGGSAAERGWSERCWKGDRWWMNSRELQKCIQGYWQRNAECVNGMGNSRHRWPSFLYIGSTSFHPVSLRIHAWSRVWQIILVILCPPLASTWACNIHHQIGLCHKCFPLAVFLMIKTLWFNATVGDFGGGISQNVFSWRCHAIGMARLDEWSWWVLRGPIINCSWLTLLRATHSNFMLKLRLLFRVSL